MTGGARRARWRRFDFVVCALSAAAVAGIALVTYWNVVEDRRLTRAANVTAADALAISVAEHVEETLRDAANAMYSAALLIEQRGGIGKVPGDAWLHQELRRELHDHTSIERMMVVDAGGRLLASSAEARVRDRVVLDSSNFGWHWRNSDSRDLHLGVTERSPVDGKFVIPYSRAIFDADGGLGALVVAEISVENLQRFHERIEAVYPSMLVMLDRAGTRLLRFPLIEPLIGRPVAGIAQMERMFREGGAIEAVNEADGRTYTFSSRRIRNHPLLVAVGRDVGLAMADWEQRTRQRVAVAGFGSAALLVLAGLLVRYVRRLEGSEASLRRSEARFRRIGDNLPDGMLYRLIQEPGGAKRFAYVSAGVERLHGLSPAEVESNSDRLYDQVLDEDRHLMRAASEQAMRSRSNFQVEARIRRSDGTVRWMRFSSAPTEDSGGTVCWDGIELDVTALRSATADLAEAENRFRTAMIHSAIGMALVGLDGRWIEVNPAICRLLGFSRDELVGTSRRETTHADDIDIGFDGVRSLLGGDIDAYQVEKRYLRKGGEPVWVEVNVTLARGGDGAPLQFIAQIQDITDRRLATERMQLARGELEARVAERTAELLRVNNDLEAFSYSVAHDLRAPLHRIAGFAGLLAECLDPAHAEAQRDLGVIQREVERMGDLITQLLALARTSQAELRRTRVDLAQLASEVRDAMTQETAGRQIVWSIALPQPVMADTGLMRQVFENLLGNAVKYTRSRPVAHIEVGIDPEWSTAREVVFFVRDDGAGFDMQYAHRLFMPFQRLHGSSEFEGTGVGLANVQRIVQRHGGRVWAKGDVGRGATFFVSLPA